MGDDGRYLIGLIGDRFMPARREKFTYQRNVSPAQLFPPPVSIQQDTSLKGDTTGKSAGVQSAATARFHLQDIWQYDLRAANGMVPVQLKFLQGQENFKVCVRRDYREYCWAGVYPSGSRSIHLIAEGELPEGAKKREFDLCIDNPDRVHECVDDPTSIVRHSPPAPDDAPCDQANTVGVEAYWAFLRARDALHKKDPQLGACWLHVSATQGHARSQSLYSAMLYSGSGVAQDYARAFTWAEKSGEQHDVFGEYMLALIYQTGNGAHTDFKKSQEWLGRFRADYTAEIEKSQNESGSPWATMTPEQKTAAIRAALSVFSFFSAGDEINSAVQDLRRQHPTMSESAAEEEVESGPAYQKAMQQSSAGLSTLLGMMLGTDEQYNDAVRQTQR